MMHADPSSTGPDHPESPTTPGTNLPAEQPEDLPVTPTSQGKRPAGQGQPSDDHGPTPSPEQKSEATTAKRSPHGEFDITAERVRLNEIDGVEEELRDFMREHDVLTELNLNIDRWAPEVVRCAAQLQHLTLWRRKGRLVHLGSGLKLSLARRIVLHDDRITASVIQNKTLPSWQKLLVLGDELLFQAAIARASAMQTPQLILLCEQLNKAGLQALRRADARHFALATGISQATVRQHWQAGTEPD